MRLSDFFVGVAAKRLSAVEVDPKRSNQQAFYGAIPLRRMLGERTGTTEFQAKFILFDGNGNPITANTPLSWSDVRANVPERNAEFHLYYRRNDVIDAAREGDLIVFGLRPDGSLLVVVGRAGSTGENQLYWLFGLDQAGKRRGLVASPPEVLAQDLGLAGRYILEELGVDIADMAEDGQLERMLATFGGVLPGTREFSAYARATLPHVSSQDDPDAALVAWFEQEERLFRLFERHLVAERLRQGFGEDVDTFTAYALSILNRRKARAGQALENHLEQVLIDHDITYTRNCRTENNSRPDFVLPGCTQYHNPDFPADRLFMLGVKSTCKDRWRQVLAEAARIPRKHLLTLEPGISRQQTQEMMAHGVQLVLPTSLHGSYSRDQRNELLGMQGFINLAS